MVIYLYTGRFVASQLQAVRGVLSWVNAFVHRVSVKIVDFPHFPCRSKGSDGSLPHELHHSSLNWYLLLMMLSCWYRSFGDSCRAQQLTRLGTSVSLVFGN